ncbi:MAG: S41 family peptidase [Sphingorhabdus sp.]
MSSDIAYIRFGLFPGDPETLAHFEKFMKAHAKAQTLIIDIRGHRGGGLAEMDILFSHIFNKQTDLLYFETRKSVDEAGASPIKAGITVLDIEGLGGVVRRKHIALPHEHPLMANTKIFILMSGYTASAAEHLSLAMKRTKRGVLVGETTRGGAHFGGTVDLEYGYHVFIPVGRAFNPDTGKDWEGTGVVPDIPVDAKRALIVALVNAGLEEEQATIINSSLNYTPPKAP